MEIGGGSQNMKANVNVDVDDGLLEYDHEPSDTLIKDARRMIGLTDQKLLRGDEDWIAFRRRYEALSEGDREKVRALLNELYSKRSARMKREN